VPAAETCNTPEDDDCDGQVNEEGAGCVCLPGSTQVCYTGPVDTLGKGECKAGQALCDAAGTSLGACLGEIVPGTETCATSGDEDCDGVANEDGVGCVCVPGATKPCYTGPAETQDIGACKAGIATCEPGGTGWGSCVGDVTPAPETCDTAQDDDCDGQVNEEGVGCACTPGATTDCYTGPSGTVGVGTCMAGTATCNAAGTAYGPCEGEVVPATETCATATDDDCDGQVNEDGAGCVCVPGAAMSCYNAPSGTLNVGPCHGGNRYCNAMGTAYGSCEGEVTPKFETCSNTIDDDCDGQVNDGCSTVVGDMNLSVTNTGARTCADGGDAVAYSVTGLTATQATLASAISDGCLAIGDEVLLINLQGTASATTNVGRYELLTVVSVSGSTVQFGATKINSYGSGASDDADIGTGAGQQRVMLQRVPAYTAMTVDPTGTLTASAWNGMKGGVLAFRSFGPVNVGGTISMDGAGFRGGPRPTDTFGNGYQGESYGGFGAREQTANLGGGGAGRGEVCATHGSSGGGGGHRLAGSNGTTGCTGNGGGLYGVADLTRIYLGSGGGSGGNDNVLFDNPQGGLGGAGGGIIMILADQINITGAVRARGLGGQGDNAAGCFGSQTTWCWDYSGPGGGGAGGSIKLTTASTGLTVDVSGGVGGLGGTTNGGAGALGYTLIAP